MFPQTRFTENFYTNLKNLNYSDFFLLLKLAQNSLSVLVAAVVENKHLVSLHVEILLKKTNEVTTSKLHCGRICLRGLNHSCQHSHYESFFSSGNAAKVLAQVWNLTLVARFSITLFKMSDLLYTQLLHAVFYV